MIQDLPLKQYCKMVFAKNIQKNQNTHFTKPKILQKDTKKNNAKDTLLIESKTYEGAFCRFLHKKGSFVVFWRALFLEVP